MPSDPKRIDHALTLAEQGKPEEADTLLAHLARQFEDPMAAWHLSWLRLARGDNAGALSVLLDFPTDPLCSERAREMLVADRRTEEALALLAKAHSPAGDPRDLVGQAIRHHLAGNYPAAVAACRQALALAPAHAPAHNHLGRALHNLGETAAALAEFERAVQAEPRYPEAWHNLGHSLRARGDLERACEALEQALLISPDYRSARRALGVTRFAINQPEKALANFEELLRRDRDDANALINAGLCMQLMDEGNKARQRFERALEIEPDNAWAHYCLGVLQHDRRELAAARASLQRSLKLQAEQPDVWAELAAVNEENQQPEQAEAAVRTGLLLSPHHPMLNIEAARIERRAGKPEAAESRLQFVAPARLPVRVRQRFHFELAKAQDRNGRSAAAFESFRQANQLAAQELARRKPALEANFRDIHEVQSWLEDGAPGLRPVLDDGDGDVGADLAFLVGFPRSGQFLVERLLQGHPELAQVQEKPTLEPLVTTLRELPGGYPGSIARLDRSDRVALRRMYRMALARHGAVRGQQVLDASPLRLAHAGLVQALFPKARLLLALRHPCDVVLRNFMEPQASQAAYMNFHTLQGAARLYDASQRLWQSLQPRLALPLEILRHEDVQRAPESALAATCAHLGLATDPEWLAQAAQRLAAGRTPGVARQGAHWQRYREQMAPVLPLLEPHVRRLGYSLDATG